MCITTRDNDNTSRTSEERLIQEEMFSISLFSQHETQRLNDDAKSCMHTQCCLQMKWNDPNKNQSSRIWIIFFWYNKRTLHLKYRGRYLCSLFNSEVSSSLRTFNLNERKLDTYCSIHHVLRLHLVDDFVLNSRVIIFHELSVSPSPRGVFF